MAGGHGEGINYKGLTMHKPKRWHVVTGKGLCAVMWFWVLYRAKQDGPVVLDYAVFFRAGDIRGRAMVTMAMRVDTRRKAISWTSFILCKQKLFTEPDVPKDFLSLLGNFILGSRIWLMYFSLS
ncbi:hypothetical protein POTOM_020170 [Populus tomentosa]|uniref:Uncharacterized protein n=1 Tax=Populus tomentosa TaxID=118781 RepID=A0A8X7ZSS2_POPTO|nr:hypothetical protein POTOM_020170 [Populus tomentosa]